MTGFSFKPLADGYALLIPTGIVFGLVSQRDQPGHAIRTDIDVPKPTIDEIVNSRDRQLDSARVWLRGARPVTR